MNTSANSLKKLESKYLKISRLKNGSVITCAHTKSMIVDEQRITSHSEKALAIMFSASL
jgi:predicted NAD/FAD-binding protein